LKIKILFIFIIFFTGLINSNFSLEWIHQEINFKDGISDGIIADLDKDGLLDILIISGRFIYIYRQTKTGFNRIPDDCIYFRQLGDFIDIGEVDSKYTGLEILGLSKNGVKYFYLEGNHYKESSNFLISQNLEKYTYNLGPAISDFAFDINNDGKDEIFLLQNNQIFLYRLNNYGRFISIKINQPYTLSTVSLESRKWPKKISLNDDSNFGYFFRPEYLVEKIVLFQDLNLDGFLDFISGNAYFQKPYFQFKAENQTVGKRIPTFRKEKQKIFLDIDGDGELDKILIEIKDILSNNMNIFPYANIFIFLKQNKNILSSKPNCFFKTVLISDKSPFVDIDKDGDLDFISIWPEISPASKENIIQIVTKYILKFKLRWYLFGKEKGYSKTPNLISKFKIKYDKLFNTGKYIPFDTRLKQKKLFFSGHRYKISKEMDHFKVIDINNDKKSDVLLLSENNIIILLSK